MRFARYSAAYLKLKEKDYNFDYFRGFLKLLIKKGFSLKAHKIYANFIVKIRLYFKLLYLQVLKNQYTLKDQYINTRKLIINPYIEMKNIDDRKNFNFFKMFIYLVNNYSPIISFLKRKVSAITYNLPYSISSIRAKMIFLRWFIKSARERTEKTMSDRLFYEFVDLYYGLGRTIRKIELYYMEAKKNYPFIKYLKTRSKFSRLIKKKYSVRTR